MTKTNEIRTLSELFQIMMANKDLFKEWNCTGLCFFTSILCEEDKISHPEYEILQQYIWDNKPPSIYREVNLYSWPVMDWPSREEWIKEQIKELKSKGQ